MSSVDRATETQLNNIQAKTGKSLDELAALVKNSGLTKHSEIRKMLIDQLGLGYGDANTLVHYALKLSKKQEALVGGIDTDNLVDEIYSGAKAGLRPIHDRLMQAVHEFGEFEIAPKKGYISLRRKKQFAMIGPATKASIEVGLNVRGLPASARLLEQPAGSMCNYKVRLTELTEADAELISWIHQAYNAAE